jgi:N-formylglutamate amidohydrolase
MLDADAAALRPFEILPPDRPPSGLIVASPHSGALYPEAFLAASRLDRLNLRKSEDCFVNELFAAAPAAGAPLIHALFPRAYIDLNREPWELDPAMFEDALPDFVNRNSARVAAGLGTVARVVADGEPIYRGKLRFAEAAERVERLYRPYHAALEAMVAETVACHGVCLLLDAHSMPSLGARGEPVGRRADIILGDRIGTSCDPSVTRTAERVLRQQGYTVGLNAPYAGGFTTRHYGRPAAGRHCLQIELNRALYMDERSLAKKSYFGTLQADMTLLIEALAALPQTLKRPG